MAHLARLALLVLPLAACGGSSPKKPGVVVTDVQAPKLIDPIDFTGEAELTPASSRSLDEVASTLIGNPSLRLVEVQVFVLDGDEATRQARADRRAQVVVDYLVGKGVAAERLTPGGYVTPTTEARTNHVQFVILQRSDGD